MRNIIVVAMIASHTKIKIATAKNEFPDNTTDSTTC